MAKSIKSIYGKADSFSRLAKSYGYRSRASLKLLEIQRKDKFIKKDSTVLDLGCSPGSWCQVVKNIIQKKGKIFGVDLKKMEPISGVHFLHKSIEELVQEDFKNSKGIVIPFDIVLSDIAPNISGIRNKDDALFMELFKIIQGCLDIYLRKSGVALIKVFHGESFEEMLIYMNSRFQKVRIRKPASSRSNSKETYLLGLDKRS